MRLSSATSRALTEAFAVWAPPERLPPSEWMEREYVISSEESAEPGRYSFDHYAFLREVFDWFADPDVEMIALPKAAQIGWTTGFTGLVGSLIATDPCRILVAMPTQDEAEIWSKDRLEPNLSATPSLRAKIRPAKSRDGNNRLTHKRFPGGALKMVGANSSTGLSSWPAKHAFCDEVDRYPLSAGGEGDPIALVRKRLQTWLRRGGKIGLGSTPKIEQTSIIWHYYELGDQRRFHVPCPHCGERKPLEWENVRWDERQPETAAYFCPDCGAAWTDLDRIEAIRDGEWRATATPSDPKIRSAWIDGLLSPHVTHIEMATQWLSCDTDEQRQAFVNLYLGRPWKVRGEAPEWQRLYDRREAWKRDRLPADVLFLTAGTDVQKDRLETRVWGWGRDKQSWLVDVRIVQGDTSRSETWVRLDEVLNDSWQHESGADLSLSRLAIDSGYATDEVYAWARRHPGRVLPVKGVAGASALLGVPAAVEVAGRRRSKRGVKLWPVGPEKAKGALYGWLRLDAPVTGEPYPAGYVHLPDWIGEDEIRQLTAEELVTERTKHGFARLVWTLVSGRRNEALDCFDEQTEVLTDEGWKLFSALQGGEDVATVNLDTKKIEYQRPTHLIRRRHEGEMIELKGRRLDILVTPNHRMVTFKKVFDRAAGKWNFDVPPEITLAKDLTIHHQLMMAANWEGDDALTFRVPAAAGHNGRERSAEVDVDAGDFAEFLGWHVAEGHVSRVLNKATNSFRYVVGLTQNEGAKAERIRAVLAKLPWRFSESVESRGSVRWNCYSKQLHDHLGTICGVGAASKRVPDCIRRASPGIIERFVDAAIAGDGWQIIKDGQRPHRTYATISKTLADGMQELFLKLGRAANVRARQPKDWNIRGATGSCRLQFHVSELKVERASLDGGGEGKREFLGRSVPYSGMVYCATVPNGTLVCRRNGLSFVAGNCRVYAHAAAVEVGIDRFSDRKWDELRASLGEGQLTTRPARAEMPASSPGGTAGSERPAGPAPQVQPMTPVATQRESRFGRGRGGSSWLGRR